MPVVIVGRRFGPLRRPSRTDRVIAAAEKTARNRTHPKMVLVAGSTRVTVPYAPRDTALSGFGWAYTEVIRPGRKPILQRANLQNWKQSFDLFLGTQNVNEAITPQWVPLLALIEGTTPITILNGPGTGKTWYITSASMAVLQRAQQTNAITRAVVTIEMTQATELVPAPGPVAAAKPPSPSPPVAKPQAPPPTPSPVRTHTVSKGESLSLIAKRYYGDLKRWPEIAKANNIRNANLITPGQKLRIP